MRAGHLHLLGDDGGDDNTFVIQTYDASSGAKPTSQSVNRATGDGYYYPAGILAP